MPRQGPPFFPSGRGTGRASLAAARRDVDVVPALGAISHGPPFATPAPNSLPAPYRGHQGRLRCGVRGDFGHHFHPGLLSRERNSGCQAGPGAGHAEGPHGHRGLTRRGGRWHRRRGAQGWWGKVMGRWGGGHSLASPTSGCSSGRSAAAGSPRRFPGPEDAPDGAVGNGRCGPPAGRDARGTPLSSPKLRGTPQE